MFGKLLPHRLLLVVLLGPLLLFAQRGASVINLKTETDSTQSLVIGISKYNQQSLELKYAHRDAQLFSSFLKDAGWSRHVHQLIDSEATAYNIYKAVKQLIVSADSTQPVFIYFAGHGDKVVESDLVGEAYLLAWDANNNRVYDGVGGTIEFSKLENYIQKLAKNRKAKVYLILDACHSGFDPYKEGMLAAYDEANEKFSSVNKLLSCSGNELAYENDRLKHGVFTYYLVQGMKGFADNPADNNITLEELKTYLTAAVQKETDSAQTPVITPTANAGIMGSLTPELKALLMQPEQKTVSGEMLAMGRTTDGASAKQTSVTDPAVLHWVDKFNEAFAARNYFGADTGCAFIIRQLGNSKKAPAFILEQMKEVLAGTLITSSQLAINEILKGKDNLPAVGYIEQARQSADSALLFLEAGDPRHQIAEVSAGYLHVFALLRKRDFKNYEAGMAVCHALLQKEKRAAYIYLIKAQLHDYREEWDSAIYFASYASKLVPVWTFPYNIMGNAYREKGDYTSAFNCFSKAIQLDSAFARSYNNIGNLYNDSRMYNRAEEYYLKSLSLKVDSAEMGIPLMNLGVVNRDRGNIIKAEQYFQQALIDSANYLAYLRLGNLEQNFKYDTKKAEEYYLKAVETEPYQAESYTELADFYRETKNDTAYWLQADSLYNTAIRLNPYYEWAYFGKAYLYYDKFKNTAKADSCINAGRLLNGNKMQFRDHLGWFYYYQDSTDKAVRTLRETIEADTLYGDAYENLHEILYKEVSHDSAFALLKTAVTRMPLNPKWYTMMGNHYYSIANYDSALHWYGKCLQVDSQFAVSYASLGVCYMEVFDAVKAIPSIQKAIAANPVKNKSAAFIQYAINQAEGINQAGKKISFLKQFLRLSNTDYNLWLQLLEETYNTGQPDKQLLADGYRYVLSGNLGKKALSVISYRLCLMAIELKDKNSLKTAFEWYSTNTRNTDQNLLAVAGYLLGQKAKKDFKDSSFDTYSKLSYAPGFNKVMSKINRAK